MLNTFYQIERKKKRSRENIVSNKLPVFIKEENLSKTRTTLDSTARRAETGAWNSFLLQWQKHEKGQQQQVKKRIQNIIHIHTEQEGKFKEKRSTHGFIWLHIYNHRTKHIIYTPKREGEREKKTLIQITLTNTLTSVQHIVKRRRNIN